MNEPKRWSSSGSDVDPVLRSVLRYARDLQPSSAELSAVVQGTVGRQRPTPAPSSRRRGKTWGLVALAATFATGAALASYGNRLWFAPKAPMSTPSVAPAKVPPPPTPVGVGVAPVPRSAPSVASLPIHSAAPARSTPVTAVSAAPTLDSAQDAALLHEARGLVATHPARALTLTRDHELHFPNSVLNEERQALRVEALARLGRHTEAARELAAFDQRFPRSIYARRLHALPLP
jgi:hypothetical protein